MAELELLKQCLQNESEAEMGGIRFVYMDPETVYRFENNKMKKVSKSLINRALKSKDKPTESPTPTPKKQIKRKKQQVEVTPAEEEEEVNEDNEDNVIIEEPVKPKKQMKPKKEIKPKLDNPQVDLDMYYSNKHKMEYMEQEMNRLNQKISKLKHYKAIVNRMSYGEIDDLPTSNVTQPQPQQQQQQQQLRTDLFMF